MTSSDRQVILLHDDGQPAAWCVETQMYLSDTPVCGLLFGGATEPCKVWKLLDHSEEYGLEVEEGVDVIGLLRSAAAVCDDEAGGQCGCGLLYGKYPHQPATSATRGGPDAAPGTW